MLPFGVHRRLSALQQTLHANAASVISNDRVLDIPELDFEEFMIDLDCTGDLLLCAHSDACLRMYQLGRLAPEAKAIRLAKFRNSVDGLAYPLCLQWFPNDNKRFMTSDVKERLNIWDTASFVTASSFPIGGDAFTISICPVSGQENLVAGISHPVVWDLRRTERPAKQLFLQRPKKPLEDWDEEPLQVERVIGGKFTSDGRRFIVMYDSRRIAAWAFPTMTLKLQRCMHRGIQPMKYEAAVRIEIFEEPCFLKSLLIYPVLGSVGIFSFEKMKVVTFHSIRESYVQSCILRRKFNQLLTYSYECTCISDLGTSVLSKIH
ncbi:hypothetical protein TTRE_0000660101 [Trichuris trichiura]|uniref:WD40 domain containing protein n=1 Tax=Trichuris trichiura TaxID=36087 RepID=A0A077ZEN6_TRITR|nr:hypothetical protein TTRE_0000660101 [Trichuris trichiura]